jgi:hypothetical protein
MALDPLIFRSLYVSLTKSIQTKQVDAFSAMTIIAKGMELLESFKELSGQQKKEYIVAVVEDIAKGADGISGTDDDLLPPGTIKALHLLVKEDLIGSIVSTISDAAKGKFDLNKAARTTASCLDAFSHCIKPK